MEITTNNCVGRLCKIMSDLINFSKEQSTTAGLLAKTFNINHNDISTISSFYLKLFMLCDQCKKQIMNTKNVNHQKLLEPINKAISLISMLNLDAHSTNAFVNSFPDDIITKLDFCSELLSATSSEQEIETSTLCELEKELETLIHSVNELNINLKLKSLLLSKLNELLNSIYDYKLFGSFAIKKEIESSTGCIIMNTTLISSEEEKNAIKLAFEYINKLNTTMSFNQINPICINSLISSSTNNNLLVQKI